MHRLLAFAEREGFEPPVPCSTTVFKTAAFDRSATSPTGGKSKIILILAKLNSYLGHVFVTLVAHLLDFPYVSLRKAV